MVDEYGSNPNQEKVQHSTLQYRQHNNTGSNQISH